MSRFDNFQARLAAKDTGDEPEELPEIPETPDDPAVEPEEQKETTMPDDKPLEEREDYQAGHAAGRKEAQDRMNTVFAHENAKGREAHAARLLGRSMSAPEIIDELSHLPQVKQLSEEEQREAAEEGGRKEMREELDKSDTKNLGSAEEPDGKTGRAKADGVWDRARAHIDNRKQKEA